MRVQRQRRSNQQVVTAVLEALRVRLLERDSSLATADALDPGLELQTRSILDEAIRATLELTPPPAVAVEYGSDPELAAHGRVAATRDRDPAEPLMAAELLFDVALSPLAGWAGADVDPLVVARHLHHAIWRRFPLGAIAYVEELRARLRSSESDTRQALSRELHDSVANPVAAAIQRIELARDDPHGLYLAEADALLREVLATSRLLASQLRSPEPVSLQSAFSTLSGDDLVVRLRVVGVERPMPERVRTEALLIAHEAVRNSVRHAVDATAIEIVLDWGQSELHLSVRDDGRSIPATADRGGLGIRGMRERAQAIQAQVDIVAGNGYLVTLTVPYAGG